MEVFVIRHTPVDLPIGTCYGQLDVPIQTGPFEEYADKYHKQLPMTIDQTISSPLTRCVQLANHLQRGNFTTDKRLMEMLFGKWEGQLWNAIPEDTLHAWTDDFVNRCPPEGENLTLVYQRVADFMASLRNSDAQQVLLVTHGGVIRCIVSYLLQIPLENAFKIPVGFGETLKFQLGKTPKEDYITQLS